MNRSRTAGVGLRGALPFSATLLLVPLIVVMALDELPDFIPWVIPWVILPLIPFIKILETLCRNDVPNLDRNTPESRVSWHYCDPRVLGGVLSCFGRIYTVGCMQHTDPDYLRAHRFTCVLWNARQAHHPRVPRADPQATVVGAQIGRVCNERHRHAHFHTEHVYMHHPNVATPRDGESARFGQSYYNYFLRVMPYVYAESIRTQYRRLARRGLPFWHKSNPVWRWIGLWIAWPASHWRSEDGRDLPPGYLWFYSQPGA